MFCDTLLIHILNSRKMALKTWLVVVSLTTELPPFEYKILYYSSIKVNSDN